MSQLSPPISGFCMLLLLYWLSVWLMHLLAIVWAKCKMHKHSNSKDTIAALPGVSVLKPLMGADANLPNNLETFFSMQYPLYELLFCIEQEHDPAMRVVLSLMEKHPQVPAAIFLGGMKVGVNPKINNMEPAYEAARYAFILISDSGIKMKDDTLSNMMLNMSEKHALVHQLPFVCDRNNFAGMYEKVFFGTVQSRVYLTADLLGVNCHNGMSSLLRKSVLDELGGLKRFSCYIAEDFFIGKAIQDAGWKMRISNQPAWQNCANGDVRSFQQRLKRWTKLRLAMIPLTTLAEPFAECMVLGVIVSIVTYLLYEWDPLAMFLIHVLLWFLCDWILLSIVQKGTLPFRKPEFLTLWLYREITGPFLYVCAIMQPVLTWRSRKYRLYWGGMAVELSSAQELDEEKQVVCVV